MLLQQYYLGGIVANCASGGLALFILSRMKFAQQVAAWNLAYASVLSLVIGLANLLPFQSKGLMSDGYCLRLI